jgi:mono/diheme cytochrome c family protein
MALFFWPCILMLAGTALDGGLGQGSAAEPSRGGGLLGAETIVASSSAATGIRPAANLSLLLVETLPSKTQGEGLSGATNQTPTYLRDVLPILMGKCSRCHNEQAHFVYNWLDYKTAYGDRWEIARRVWDSWQGHYFKESMPIANSPESLAITEEERLRVRSWVNAGAPRGVAPPPGAPKSKADKVQAGRQLFSSICAACHQPTGRGIPNVFPPLAGSDYLNADKGRAIKTVINGRQGEIVVNGLRFNNSMPKFPLSDDDIANVLTFVYNSFGNAGIEVTPSEVATLRLEAPEAQGSSAPQPKSAFE